jgi:hypothetical protein
MPAEPDPPKGSSKRLAQERRQARLAVELRSNLLKRRAQMRAHALHKDGAGPEQDGPEQDGPEQDGHQPDAREAANADGRGPTGEVA